MSLRSFATVFTFLAVAAFAGALGCSKPDTSKPAAKAEKGHGDVHDHGDGSAPHSHGADPHDVVITEKDVKKPADFNDAVARIKQYRDQIERDTATATPGLAHRPLDELDIVLKWLPGIARDSNVPKSEWEAINTTGNQLRELFEKVHGNIDAKKNPDFPSVKKGVDEGIGRLEAAGKAPAAK